MEDKISPTGVDAVNAGGLFGRFTRLVGEEAAAAVSSKRVIIFGVGGVGSWCVEALVRSGIRDITIVDADCVDVSNINRQLPATTQTVGQPKVEVMRRRMLEINPHADITAIQAFYDASTADRFDFNDYDYVIDAIDSLQSKMLLIRLATVSKARLYSSMGAALKSDPTSVRVAEFWKVRGCPLARALRDRFKRSGDKPRRKFMCVYSEQLLRNQGTTTDSCSYKATINGTTSYIPPIFGFTLAGLVVEDAIKKY